MIRELIKKLLKHEDPTYFLVGYDEPTNCFLYFNVIKGNKVEGKFPIYENDPMHMIMPIGFRIIDQNTRIINMQDEPRFKRGKVNKDKQFSKLLDEKPRQWFDSFEQLKDYIQFLARKKTTTFKTQSLLKTAIKSNVSFEIDCNEAIENGIAAMKIIPSK